MPGWQPNCGNTGEIGRVTPGRNDDRRRIGRSGGLLATAVVLGLGVAAVGVRAAAGATLRDAGLAAFAAFGLALLFAIVALGTATRYREHVRRTDAASSVEDRLRQATIAVLFASAALVPFALLLLRRPGANNPSPQIPELITESPGPTSAHPPAKRHAPFSFDLRAFLFVVTIVIGVLLLLWLLAMAIRLLRKVRIVVPTAFTPLIESQAEDEALADALLAGRSALAGDDTRAAIIACYAAMEASLEQVGVNREQSDSPSDLLQRAMNRDLPGTGSRDAVTLTALFREARFSTHPMTAEQLETARSALDAVMAALSERMQAQVVAS